MRPEPLPNLGELLVVEDAPEGVNALVRLAEVFEPGIAELLPALDDGPVGFSVADVLGAGYGLRLARESGDDRAPQADVSAFCNSELSV